MCDQSHQNSSCKMWLFHPTGKSQNLQYKRGALGQKEENTSAQDQLTDCVLPPLLKGQPLGELCTSNCIGAEVGICISTFILLVDNFYTYIVSRSLLLCFLWQHIRTSLQLVHLSPAIPSTLFCSFNNLYYLWIWIVQVLIEHSYSAELAVIRSHSPLIFQDQLEHRGFIV